jgi:hypothetical protein
VYPLSVIPIEILGFSLAGGSQSKYTNRKQYRPEHFVTLVLIRTSCLKVAGALNIQVLKTNDNQGARNAIGAVGESKESTRAWQANQTRSSRWVESPKSFPSKMANRSFSCPGAKTVKPVPRNHGTLKNQNREIRNQESEIIFE